MQRKAKTDGAVISCTIANEKLRAHPDNYNRHPRSQIEKLRASLRKFGQVQSVVVQEREDGEFTIVAGHALVEAAREEGITELAARKLPREWSDRKVKAYLAADNELARFSDRDEAQLLAILEDIATFDQSLLAATGYSLESIRAMDEAIAKAANIGEWIDQQNNNKNEQDGTIWRECPRCQHRWPAN